MYGHNFIWLVGLHIVVGNKSILSGKTSKIQIQDLGFRDTSLHTYRYIVNRKKKERLYWNFQYYRLYRKHSKQMF